LVLKIKSHIYVIKNNTTGKIYVGQANSHRMNKNKYRYFGYIGRFNDHISEAYANTKKKQCRYLNNSIRKYGKDNFSVELIEVCELDKADEKEIYYINKYNSLYPNGYNLTKGGKNFTIHQPEEKLILNSTKEKRGRDFGYTHKEETIEKMKQYHLNKNMNLDYVQTRKKNISDKLTKVYETKRIERLSQMIINLPLEQYIFPVYKKDTNIIQNYAVKMSSIKNKKGYVIKTNDTIENKYNTLLNNLKTAYEKSKNCSDNSKGLMDDPQPLT